MDLIRVELTDAAGRTIEQIRDGGALRDLIPAVSDERFACWRFVDPYGETVFNHLQLPILRREIALLRPSANPQRASAHRIDVDHILDLIEDLAASRTGTLHRYLRFVGE
jgi:hypothetical protein